MDECCSELQILRGRMSGLGEELDGVWAEQERTSAS